MTRITKREFGTRHYKPVPPAQLDESAQGWTQRVDWLVVALVVAVFVAAYLWLF